MNELEICLDERTANVKLLEQDGNRFLISVDDNNYDAHIIMVERGVYLLLMDGSHTILN